MRNLLIFCALLCFLPSAKADTLAPCSPNCTFLDPYRLDELIIPSTVNTIWEGASEDIPYGTFLFGIYATPDTTHIDYANIFSEAYLRTIADSAGALRHARNLGFQAWVNFENGYPGWTEDANGVISFSDQLNSTENPEPSTWLMMATGVILLGYLARKRHFFSTIMSSQ